MSSPMTNLQKQSRPCQKKQCIPLRVSTIIRNEKTFPLIDLCDSDDDGDNIGFPDSKPNFTSNTLCFQNTTNTISSNTNSNNLQYYNMTNINHYDSHGQCSTLSGTTSTLNSNNNNSQFPFTNYLYSPIATLPSNIGIGEQTTQSSNHAIHFQSFASSSQLTELQSPIQPISTNNNNNLPRIEDYFNDNFDANDFSN
jgi:hypothetical protein